MLRPGTAWDIILFLGEYDSPVDICVVGREFFTQFKYHAGDVELVACAISFRCLVRIPPKVQLASIIPNRGHFSYSTVAAVALLASSSTVSTLSSTFRFNLETFVFDLSFHLRLFRYLAAVEKARDAFFDILKEGGDLMLFFTESS